MISINIFYAIIATITQIHIWTKIYKEKPKITKTIIIVLVSSILFLLSDIIINPKFKFLITTTIFFIANKIVFKKNNLKTLFSTFLSLLLLSIAEMIFALLITFVFRNNFELGKEKFLNSFVSNISINLITVLLAKIKLIPDLYNYWIDKIKKRQVQFYITISMVIIIFINIIFYQGNFYGKDPMVFFLTGLFSLVIFIVLMLKLFTEERKTFTIKMENELLIENLKSYEEMLDIQRMSNHENKNQLLVIKGLIGNKNIKVKKYIDSLITETYDDNEKLLFQTKKIPSGGLQGLIYQKLLSMEYHGINFGLNISRNADLYKLNNLDTKSNQDLCKIIGVYLDNSIEAALKTEDKIISISFYEDLDILNITISNSYSGIINVQKLNRATGRGYGLSLVSSIAEKTKTFEFETEISEDYFKQNIKIKM